MIFVQFFKLNLCKIGGRPFLIMRRESWTYDRQNSTKTEKKDWNVCSSLFLAPVARLHLSHLPNMKFFIDFICFSSLQYFYFPLFSFIVSSICDTLLFFLFFFSFFFACFFFICFVFFVLIIELFQLFFVSRTSCYSSFFHFTRDAVSSWLRLFSFIPFQHTSKNKKILLVHCQWLILFHRDLRC